MENVSLFSKTIENIKNEIKKDIVGQDDVVENVIIAIIAIITFSTTSSCPTMSFLISFLIFSIVLLKRLTFSIIFSYSSS